MTKDNKQQLEEKINRVEKNYKTHKKVLKMLRWVVGMFIGFCIFCFFFEYRDVLYLAIAGFAFSWLNAHFIALRERRKVVDNMYEWLTNMTVMERKDATIHNLVEVFFTLKEDIRNNILNRDEIYDRIIGITGLINTGDIIKEDCVKPVVDKKP